MKKLVILCVLTSLFAFLSLGVFTTRVHADSTSQVNQLIAQALSPIINSLQALQNQLAGDESKLSQQDQRITRLENNSQSTSPILGVVINTYFAHEDDSVCIDPRCNHIQTILGPAIPGNFGITLPTVYISTGQGFNLTDGVSVAWAIAHFPGGDVKSNSTTINGIFSNSIENKSPFLFSDPNPSTDPVGTHIPVDFYTFYAGVTRHYQFDVINDGNNQSWQSWTNTYSE
jgi:hypothetical protein